MTVQKCTSIIYLRLLTEKKASTGDGARSAMRYYAVIGGPWVKIEEMFPQGSAVASSPFMSCAGIRAFRVPIPADLWMFLNGLLDSHFAPGLA